MLFQSVKGRFTFNGRSRLSPMIGIFLIEPVDPPPPPNQLASATGAKVRREYSISSSARRGGLWDGRFTVEEALAPGLRFLRMTRQNPRLDLAAARSCDLF